jgi:hypothetical protein
VPHSPSPPIDVDDQVQDTPPCGRETRSRRSPSPTGIEATQTPSQSPSPQAGSKRQHGTDEENGSDVEEPEIEVRKAQKIPKKNGRPKAGDFDEIGKELVLAAANTYRALLASQGAFPNPSEEVKLIKKSWKLVNEESGMTPLSLTPSIVTIVSKFIRSQVILL